MLDCAELRPTANSPRQGRGSSSAGVMGMDLLRVAQSLEKVEADTPMN